MTEQLDVFIDYVCPFCFLAEGAFETVARERDVDVHFRPFELRPEPVPTLRVEDDYLPYIWRTAVYSMAERLNVPIRLPDISPQPRTATAFVVLQLAQETGRGAEYSSAVFRSFFQNNEDIGEEKVILDVATQIGLEPEETRRALRSESRKTRHRNDQLWASQELGISAVPSVLFRGVFYPGVPGPGQLERLIDGATSAAPRE